MTVGWCEEVFSIVDTSETVDNTDSTIFTDSNGREFMPLVHDMQTEAFVREAEGSPSSVTSRVQELMCPRHSLQ
jgi:hypothetical protein